MGGAFCNRGRAYGVWGGGRCAAANESPSHRYPITIEYRFGEGKAERFERLPELAADLVRLKVDLIVVTDTPASLAARSATTTIPIVMVSVGDPVAAGLVVSLARPGGNVTGFSNLS